MLKKRGREEVETVQKRDEIVDKIKKKGMRKKIGCKRRRKLIRQKRGTKKKEKRKMEEQQDLENEIRIIIILRLFICLCCQR